MFTAPSFQNFMTLVQGWVLSTGRRTISRVIQFGGMVDAPRHHSVFYRFFSRAVWNPDELGLSVFRIVLELLPQHVKVVLTVDDTLCRKGGAHIFGGGMHHDPLLSNYCGGKKALKLLSFGHCWVILCVLVTLPWNRERVMALPIGFRLYRPKKRCAPDQYRKRTALARELVEKVSELIPEKRRVLLIGDTEYAGREVVRGLTDRIVFVGPMHMGAALYDMPQRNNKGFGRPRKKGTRLLSPIQLIESNKTPWKSRRLTLYGKKVQVLTKTQNCLWYRVAGNRLVRMIVTRDPKGRIEDRAYFVTDAKMGVREIAQSFSMRWSQEEMHRNIKQYLGLEDPQNGWWRRPKGQRRNKRIPGPKPHKTRGAKAVAHTVPFILTIYALVVLWYLVNGSAKDDVERARARAPWYRDKVEPSFADMLAALRRCLWAEQSFSEPNTGQDFSKYHAALIDYLCAA
jgi:hypothetical protein